MVESLLFHFRDLEDPRVPGLVTYPLDELLLAAVSGVLSGMDDWESIHVFSVEQMDWLRELLPYKKGIPSAQTFRAVFRALDQACFAESFMAWVTSIAGQVEGVVAIDGKTSRGSKHHANGDGALHMLRAFAHGAGLVIGQQVVDGKTNEITAIPSLLESLRISGAIITIDAMGTQRAIAKQIVDCEADYVLALKGNQSALHEDVRLFFEEASQDVAWHTYEETTADHGRIETRHMTVTDDIAWLTQRHPWEKLLSIAKVHATRTHKKDGTTSEETRYYISSLNPDPTSLLATIRSHWSIENTLHWSLDVTFKDDASRNRTDDAAANLGTIKHIAFNLLKQNNTKISLTQKRHKAAFNKQYRTLLINSS